MTSEDIDATLNLVLGGRYDAAMTATEFHGFLWKKDAQGFYKGVNHDASIQALRQERDPDFLEVGAVYANEDRCFSKSPVPVLRGGGNTPHIPSEGLGNRYPGWIGDWRNI